MIFHEIYGLYYCAVSEVLNAALKKTQSSKKRSKEAISLNEIENIIKNNAFDETALKLAKEISEKGKWQLLDKDGQSVLQHEVSRPLTKLEKQWMKALLADPRIRLFEPDETGLEDIKPLFHPDDFVYYDQFQDGDPYDDERYIQIFRSILQAINTHTSVRIRYQLKNGMTEWRKCNPIKMEYSQREDKFRVLSSVNGKRSVFNVASVQECLMGEPYSQEECKTEFHDKRMVELLVKDTGRILERLLIQFSIYERETKRLENYTYKVVLKYEAEDEKDIMIKVLSFGPGVRVIAPENFVKNIKNRIEMQMDCSER